ncbi:hypothetical protein IPH92_04130 [Candidatus Kaiserbacteria bacterium]|nr:MAG: hypothetical protein IPH92_04130 [Candidatus Kaiserbacteria bacterium]
MHHIDSYRSVTITACLFILGCIFSTALPSSAFAQVPSFIGSSIYLESKPQYPEPQSTATVSLNDYSVNTFGATINWFVNGVEQVGAKNNRSITVPTREIGSQEVVKAVLSYTNAPSQTATLTLTPIVIDIILEADTYVPSFYKGRALPSQESRVRAIALVHDAKGGIKGNYVYKWSAGSTVLLGGPVKGKFILEYAMPRYSDNELTVEVLNTEGTTLGKKTILLNPEETQLHFYEYSSLRGLSERTVANPFSLISEETTLYGEPYFMNTRINTAEADFTWTLDNNAVVPNQDAPNAITLRRTGITGTSEVSLRVVTKNRIPQYVMQKLQLIF